MDAFETQEAQADLFKGSTTVYLHCCDFSNTFTFTVPSLPFLSVNGLFTHLSFTDSPLERRMCILPLSEQLLKKLEGLKSPAVVNVDSSVTFEVCHLFMINEATCIFSCPNLLYKRYSTSFACKNYHTSDKTCFFSRVVQSSVSKLGFSWLRSLLFVFSVRPRGERWKDHANDMGFCCGPCLNSYGYCRSSKSANRRDATNSSIVGYKETYNTLQLLIVPETKGIFFGQDEEAWDEAKICFYKQRRKYKIKDLLWSQQLKDKGCSLSISNSAYTCI